MRTFEQPRHRPIGNKGNGYNFLVQPGWRLPIRCKEHVCIRCHRQFYGNHEQQRWCTRNCWAAWRRTHGRLSTCPVCGKQFKSRRTPLGPQQHCSQRCYGLSRRGPKHHRWSTGRYAKPIPTQIEQISQLHKRHARRHRTGREVGRVEVQETRANTGRLCVSSSSTGSSQS